VRKLSFLAFILVISVVPSFAQIPKANVFIGYSYLNADTNLSNRLNVNGWNASVEGKVLPFLGAVADFSSHYAGQTVCVAIFPNPCAPILNGRLDSYLFGPRVSVSIGRIRPFAHALFGVAHTSTSGSAASDTSFATGLGGGVDFKLVQFMAWRGQVDLLQTRLFSNTQNNVRVSTGIVFRF